MFANSNGKVSLQEANLLENVIIVICICHGRSCVSAVKFIHFVIRKLCLGLIIRGSGKCALKLIDFGRSIDMKAFDPCTQFTGSSNTSGFVCTEMKTGKPWSWQVGMAGSHIMLASPTPYRWTTMH